MALGLGSGVQLPLEVVPLVLVAYPALEDLRMSKASAWVQKYKWPVYFFVAVAFWNMVGAGLFGFMINPPIALYYMQGLNTTPLHAHAALFGVYGMLGIGLMLMCLRAILPCLVWKEGMLSFAFWAMNIGLLAMCVISLLPVGLMQTWASVEKGYWYARSPEFMRTDVIRATAAQLRVPGDTIFARAIALVWFVAGLKTGHSLKRGGSDSQAREPELSPIATSFLGTCWGRCWPRLDRLEPKISTTKWPAGRNCSKRVNGV